MLALSLALWAAERTPRPWGEAEPVKLTPGMGENKQQKMGAQGYGKEGDWLNW